MIDSGSYSQWILDSSKRFSGCFGVSSGYPMTTIENGWMFSGSLNISLMASIGLVIGVAPHHIEFDPEPCRNIDVECRYVQLVMDRIGGAGHLIDEMGFAD